MCRSYNPEYIWGPPAYGYYPPLYYPEVGFGFGFGPGIYIGGFFGGLGWGGWGWGPNWFGHSIYVNNYFFHRYGFNDFHGGGSFQGRGAWAHDPGHRLGVPYSNSALSNRFRGASGVRGGAGGGQFGGQRYATPREPVAQSGESWWQRRRQRWEPWKSRRQCPAVEVRSPTTRRSGRTVWQSGLRAANFWREPQRVRWSPAAQPDPATERPWLLQPGSAANSTFSWWSNVGATKSAPSRGGGRR